MLRDGFLFGDLKNRKNKFKMRRCVVPGCNEKNQQPRPMFLPPKDQIQFQKWQIVLQFKRPLKRNDLVCHLHFYEHEIQRYFNHTIKGELLQLERCRARISEHAVPSQNLPNKNELNKILSAKRTVTKKGTKNTLKSRSPAQSTTEINEEDDEENKEISPESQNDLLMQAFNNLYNNVFQVNLPNTLWGVQRCLYRSMIYFSYMHMEKLRHTKLLTIDDHGSFNTYFNDKLYSKIKETSQNLTVEYVSKCLAILDKTQK